MSNNSTDLPLPSELIEFTATILSTRSHKRFAFLDLQFNDDAFEVPSLDRLKSPLQAVLDESADFHLINTLNQQRPKRNWNFKDAIDYLQPGAIVVVCGNLGKTKIGTLSVFLKKVELLRIAPDPGRILRLLLQVNWNNEGSDNEEGTKERRVQKQEAATLVAHSLPDLLSLLPQPFPTPTTTTSTSLPTSIIDPSNPLWPTATIIARHMTDTPLRTSKIKKRVIAKWELESLENSERKLVERGLWKDPVEKNYDDLKDEVDSLAEALKLELSLSSAVPEDDVNRRLAYETGKKLPQIAWFVRSIRDLLKEAGIKKGTIVDIGGGRGALACALIQGLNQEFPEMQVVAVDVNTTSLAQGRQLALQLPPFLQKRIEFIQLDASKASLEDWARLETTLFISLHACGGLSDLVLSLSLSLKVPYLICQCCYPKYPHLNPNIIESTQEEARTKTLKSLAECDDFPEVQHRAGVCVSLERLRGRGEVWVFRREWSPRNLVLKGLGRDDTRAADEK